ncbi:MAG TPA: hypothetical protein VJ276_17995 [Thermoanaerobaculia bacterium]|nr:hypothetical protein [Thermoanaerobaculia bacterium]
MDHLDAVTAQAFCSRPTGATAATLKDNVAAFQAALNTARPTLAPSRQEAFDRIATEFNDELTVLAQGQRREYQNIELWLYPATAEVTRIFAKYNVTPHDDAFGGRSFDDNSLGFIWIRMATTELPAAIQNADARHRVASCFQGGH